MLAASYASVAQRHGTEVGEARILYEAFAVSEVQLGAHGTYATVFESVQQLPEMVFFDERVVVDEHEGIGLGTAYAEIVACCKAQISPCLNHVDPLVVGE